MIRATGTVCVGEQDIEFDAVVDLRDDETDVLSVVPRWIEHEVGFDDALELAIEREIGRRKEIFWNQFLD